MIDDRYWSAYSSPIEFHLAVGLLALFCLFGLVAGGQVALSYWRDRHWIRAQKLARKARYAAYLAGKSTTNREKEHHA
jgi:hypothetical protein